MPGNTSELMSELQRIGWNRSELARRLGCSVTLVRRWENGVIAMPPAVLHWLGVVVRAVERYPAPDDWRPRPDLTLRTGGASK